MHIKSKDYKIGINPIVIRDEVAPHMDLDLSLWIAKQGEIKIFDTKNEEMTVLLLTGKVEYETSIGLKVVSRKSVFDENGALFTAFNNETFKVKVLEDSELLIIQTDNKNSGEAEFIVDEKVRSEFFGKDDWDNTALRRVRTYFDLSNRPKSNLVVGEVVTYPGRWSSYLPHRHPQAELYFFKFDKPQAFGISVAGDNAYVVRTNDVNAVPAELIHPVSAAPGYPLYYCWIIKNLPNNPWHLRHESKEHLWLKDKNVTYWKKGKNE